MKLLLLPLAVLALGFGYSLQDPAAKKPADAAAGQDMPKPGPEHAMLLKGVGTWDAVVMSKDMAGNDTKTKATMTTRKGSDFHTIDDFKGEFMGMPFVGHGVNGYCPVKKEFFTCWTDSMTPSPMILTGTYDAKTKKMTMGGECVGMSGKMEKCRTETVHTDADHVSFKMFGPGPDGEEMQHIHIEYTRKK
jgi:hypothetical protein